jgi:hypothetical protein
MFAGSVVGLKPNTAYEVRLLLTDPDGGNAEKRVQMRTYAEPVAPDGLPVKHVIPGNGGGSGTKTDPFRGLDAAHAASQPGTLFLLHKGAYVKDQCKDNT